MRTLLIISLVLASCTHEVSPTLVQTKYNVGVYQDSYVHDNSMTITTTKALVILQDNVSVPDSARCYVRIKPCLYDYHPQIASQLERHYFYWHGSDQEYLMKNRIDF
jgi:hypothetical protein